MPDQPRITFQLTARDANRLEVRVAAPGGETRGETALPDPALLDELTANQQTGRIPAALVEKTGKALYATLVSEAVDELVIDTLNDAIRASVPLVFELRFDPDQIALTQYPWEMIQNGQGQYLIRDGLVDLTRYITYPQPPPSFDPSIMGLPLFRVICTPGRLPPLTSGALAIKPIDTLEHASFDDFMRKLLIDRLKLWGLHFDGHGALAQQCANCDTLNGPADAECWSCHKPLIGARKVGALAFEKDGDVAWIAASEFGSVLYNAHARLALLLACETAKVGNKIVFSGLAPGLLLAGVPAVIGMQYPILDTFAGSFANEFYGSLVKDNDILAAMRVARRMNMLDAWYSPALYLRRQPTPQEVSKQAVYLTRNIDTAAPAQVSAGAVFLTRLWIRRPETKPLSAAKLRAELDIPKNVPVKQAKGEAEVKFEPVEGRKLRRGEVDVKLSSKDWDVTPDLMKLFIDETLDAPPAIFTVRAKTVGKQPLIFSVMQDGGVIHTVTHIVEALGDQNAAAALPEVTEHSGAVNLTDDKRAAAVAGVGAGVAGEIPKMAEPPAPPPPPKPAPAAAPTSPPAPLPEGEGSIFYPLEEETPAMGGAPDWLDDTQTGEQTPREEQPRLDPDDTEVAKPPAPRAAAPGGALADRLLSETERSSPTGKYDIDRTKTGGKAPAAAPGGDLADRMLEETERSSRTEKFEFDPSKVADKAPATAPGYQQSPAQAPAARAPVAAPAAMPQTKGGARLGPILIIGGLGIAAIVIGALIMFGGLFNPPPAPPKPADTLGPSAPALVWPVAGEKVECQPETILRWQDPGDPSGVREYAVELDRWAGDHWENATIASPRVEELPVRFDCANIQEERYRWRAQAIDNAGNRGEFSPHEEFLVYASGSPVINATELPTAPPVVLTPPAFGSVEILNINQAYQLGGYDYGNFCGDSTIHQLQLAVTIIDPDGFQDVTVEAHYTLENSDHVPVGQEFTLRMDTQGDGYYETAIDIPRAATSVKYSSGAGEIRLYLVAMDSLGVPVYFPNDIKEGMAAPIYEGCVPG